MLIILAIFSLTQLVCSQFQEMVHGVFLASQSGSGPAGERRGLVSAQQPKTKQGWRHLFLLVNANKVLLPNVGLCEHSALVTPARVRSRSFYHHQRVIPSSVAQAVTLTGHCSL